MDEYDLSDSITIKLVKAKDYVGFSHWEVDIQSEKADVFLAGTGPSFLGVLDMASEYLYDQYQENEWFKDNANDA
jgi:hypothetical protein